jgi:hypothetical protein
MFSETKFKPQNYIFLGRKEYYCEGRCYRWSGWSADHHALGTYKARRYRKIQIGYVRPSVRGRIRPTAVLRSFVFLRAAAMRTFVSLIELCFIEFDIPNDSGGGRRRTTSSRTRESSAGIRLNIFIQLAFSSSHVSSFFSLFQSLLTARE